MNSLTNLTGTPSTYTPLTPAQQTTIIFNPPPVGGVSQNWPILIQLRPDCVVANKVAASATVTVSDLILALVTIQPLLSPPPVIQSQPLPITVIHPNPGQAAVGAVMAYNTLPITFQWQIQAPGGGAFTNLSNGGVWSGVDTYQITVTPIDTSLNGSLLQCVCSGGGGTTTSNPILLTVT